MIQQLTLIALGGACGALARHAVTSGMVALFGRSFPLGTLVVNVVGGLAIGMLYVALNERGLAGADAWRGLLVVGFLGALTTFSAFSIETLNLFEGGRPLAALVNMSANVGLSLGACWLGLLIARA